MSLLRLARAAHVSVGTPSCRRLIEGRPAGVPAVSCVVRGRVAARGGGVLGGDGRSHHRRARGTAGPRRSRRRARVRPADESAVTGTGSLDAVLDRPSARTSSPRRATRPWSTSASASPTMARCRPSSSMPGSRSWGIGVVETLARIRADPPVRTRRGRDGHVAQTLEPRRCPDVGARRAGRASLRVARHRRGGPQHQRVTATGG